MNTLHFTANNSQCVLDCFQGPFLNYFDKNYHLFTYPTNGTLLTVNLLGVFAGVVLCGLNCCSPCCIRDSRKPREISPLFKAAIRDSQTVTTATAETALITRSTDTPAFVATSTAKTVARVAGALAVTGLAVGMSAWALGWNGLHNLAGPLNYAEGLIQSCYRNCTL